MSLLWQLAQSWCQLVISSQNRCYDTQIIFFYESYTWVALNIILFIKPRHNVLLTDISWRTNGNQSKPVFQKRAGRLSCCPQQTSGLVSKSSVTWKLAAYRNRVSCHLKPWYISMNTSVVMLEYTQIQQAKRHCWSRMNVSSCMNRRLEFQ